MLIKLCKKKKTNYVSSERGKSRDSVWDREARGTAGLAPATSKKKPWEKCQEEDLGMALTG